MLQTMGIRKELDTVDGPKTTTTTTTTNQAYRWTPLIEESRRSPEEF